MESTDELLSLLQEMEQSTKPNIRLTTLDSSLSCFKGKTVVLLGSDASELLKLLATYQITPSYLCYPSGGNEELDAAKAIPKVSLEKLATMGKKQKNIAVIISTIDYDNLTVVNQLKKFNIQVISYKEATHFFAFQQKCALLPLVPTYQSLLQKNTLDAQASSKDFYEYVSRHSYETNFNMVIMPVKTGDHTLLFTLEEHKNPYWMAHHAPAKFDKDLAKKLPQTFHIFLGIRDPLSLYLSALYQDLAFLSNPETEWLHQMAKTEDIFVHGGDIQAMFDFKFQPDLYGNYITDFMDLFAENVVDIRGTPFDQEKGYVIVEEKNIKVFAYQLEKLNDLVKEASDFLGQHPFEQWEVRNTMDEKWVAESYEQAKKELQVSRSLYQRSYENPWVEYFYDSEQIKAFQKKWEGRIKEDS